MINPLISVVISLVISLGAYFAPHQQQPISPQIQAAIQSYVDQAMKGPIFGTTQPIAGQTYNLAGAGVSQTGTSITLASFTIPQNGYKIPDSALSDTFYITLEPGNPTKQEIVSCTTDVQNANGTATFTGCTRGLSPIPDYTSSSSLKFSHGGGTQVIFSNPPQFYEEFALLQNTNTFSGTNSFTGATTFSVSPSLTTDCTVASGNSAICAKHYIDLQVSAGAANANETTAGLVELATGREAASSTSIGGTGARLDLPASLATSSPWSGATTTIVATRGDHKIDPGFIATTTLDNYFFQGSMTFATTTITKALVGTSTVLTDATTVNVDWGAANTQTVTLAGNRTITFSDLTVGESLKMLVCQSSGSNTLIWPTIRWQFGSAPILTTTAGKCDIFSFFIATSTATVYGAMSANF